MKEPRYGGDLEYVYGSRFSGEALGQFVFANMPSEALEAVRTQVVTPTVTELLRLARIEIDGQPPLSIDELIGPTTIGELDPKDQAFYFSGPYHPILVKARGLPTFVTYRNILDVCGDLGIRQDAATKNFKSLVKELFEDDAVPTFGQPDEYKFERRDPRGIPMLHRFALRRTIAQMAMNGEYRVGISGTRGTNVFNGYGRSLIRALYEPGESLRRMELTMELETMADLLVQEDDPRHFKWGEAYKDASGIGHRLHTYDLQGVVRGYIQDLLQEIGAIDPGEYWPRINISERAFAVAVNALCSLDNKHSRAVKDGQSCTQGVHRQGMTRNLVHKAQAVAKCLTEKAEEEHRDDEINLSDPDLQSDGVRKVSKRSAPAFEW